MTKKAIIIPAVILTLALILLLGITRSWSSWESNSADQKTDDATVRADVTPLSTRVSGTVRQVNVADYATVVKGQCLVEIEDSDYRAVLDQAKAGLAAAEAEYAGNQDSKRIQEQQIASVRTSVTQAEAALRAAKAGVVATEGDYVHANQEIERQQSLFSVKAATKQQVEAATANATRAAGGLDARKADAARAEAAYSQANVAVAAALAQRAALNTRDEGLRAQIDARKAAITAAEVNVAYTKICAPNDGTVGERHVRPGQLVAAGLQIIDLVSNAPWIQANFKETQLHNIHPGDRVDVRIDSLPGQLFHGHVVQVAPASGSQFALIPPDNATGNYTKVVQRVPVKIALDPEEVKNARILPGLSAVVTVHTTPRVTR
ncbi:MAG TPA: HlyD family secretion protein [Edaphobacter sp.]